MVWAQLDSDIVECYAVALRDGSIMSLTYEKGKYTQLAMKLALLKADVTPVE